jgi:hypothetical protein
MKAVISWIACFAYLAAFGQSTVSSYLGLQLNDALIWYSAISEFALDASDQEGLAHVGHLGIENSLELDYDEDGVIHRYDSCPDTPAGSAVDVNGCALKLLEPELFRLSATNLSCSASADGMIEIEASQDQLDFVLYLNGAPAGQLNASNAHRLQLSELSAENYTLCAEPIGGGFQSRCFEVSLRAPEALQVDVDAQIEKGVLDLRLGKGKIYEIVHNGQRKRSTEANQRLILSKGMNTVEVKTDLPCQGSFSATYFVSEEVRVYPNPTKGISEVYIGGSDESATLILRTASGAFITERSLSIPQNRLVHIDLSAHNPGLYLIEIKGEHLRATKKLIKQ